MLLVITIEYFQIIQVLFILDLMNRIVLHDQHHLIPIQPMFT